MQVVTNRKLYQYSSTKRKYLSGIFLRTWI